MPSLIRNRFLLNMDYIRKKTIVSGLPAELTVELTNFCNLSCIFCPHAKMKRQVGFMDFRLFKDIVEQTKGYLELIDLDLMGETLFHPEIFNIISYCKKSGVRTMLHSNMTVTDNKLAGELISAGLDMLVMGMDAATRPTYETLRKGANFEITKKNIEFVLSRYNRNLFKVVQMIYTHRNKDESDSFLKMWKNTGADYVRLHPYENTDKDLLELNAIPVNRNCINRKPCVQIWRKFAVCWDGTVVSCCSDYDKFTVLGDLKNDTIVKIWNAEPMVNLRRKHATGNLSTVLFCKECRLFQPSSLLLWGSLFVNAFKMRKIFFKFEKLLIKKNIAFFRYF